MSELDVDQIGAAIVKHQRGARFAETTPDQWGDRLMQFIGAQAGVSDVRVANVREVGTAAGGSNGTLLFEASWTEDGEPRSSGLVLRFMPTRGLFHAYDVTAQFNLQRALEATDVPVPPQIWLDPDGNLLGRPGYVMGMVEGASAPMTWMTSGIIADAEPAARREMQLGYLEALARVHALDWRALGLEWLEKRAAGARPIEREVNWYWDSLEYADCKPYLEALRPLRDWLVANEPADIDTVLCHGDANFGNYLYLGTAVSAVVDWEMSFLGTPECDVCFTHMGDQIIQNDVPALEGTLSYQQRIAEYERRSGRKLRNMPYFELFTAYRLAVINVLTFRHFPEPILRQLLPVIERGPKIAADLAARVGLEILLPPSGTID